MNRLTFRKAYEAQHYTEHRTQIKRKKISPNNVIPLAQVLKQNIYNALKHKVSYHCQIIKTIIIKAIILWKKGLLLQRRMCFNVLKVHIAHKVPSSSFRQENELSSLLQVTLPIWPAMAQCSLYLVIHFQ